MPDNYLYDQNNKFFNAASIKNIGYTKNINGYPVDFNVCGIDRSGDLTSEVGFRYLDASVNPGDEQLFIELMDKYDCDFEGTLRIDCNMFKNETFKKYIKDLVDDRKIRIIYLYGDTDIIDNNFLEYFSNASFFCNNNSKQDLANEYKNLIVLDGFSCDFDYNENGYSETSFFVDSFLDDDRIDTLVKQINKHVDISKDKKVQLDVRFYDPSLYFDFINKVISKGLDKNISISVLSNPLTDDSETFNKLKDLPVNIDIIYSTCQDMIDRYQEEPFCCRNFHFSDLEAGSITGLDNYVEVLKLLENFEKQVSSNDELTKAIAAYDYIKSNYIYEDDTSDASVGRDVDKIIQNKKSVCVGFANLFSMLCRRVDVPVFTYSTLRHVRNIGRIIKKDKNGKIIFDKICTFDPTWDNNDLDDLKEDTKKYNYINFGKAPGYYLKKLGLTEFFNTANVLDTNGTDIEYCGLSYDKFLGNFHYSLPYNPYTYVYRMLELMGYDYDHKKITDFICELNDEGKIGSISPKYIAEAVANYKGLNKEEELLIRNSINDYEYDYYGNNSNLLVDNNDNYSSISISPLSEFIPEYEKVPYTDNRINFNSDRTIVNNNSNMVALSNDEYLDTDISNDNYHDEIIDILSSNVSDEEKELQLSSLAKEIIVKENVSVNGNVHIDSVSNNVISSNDVEYVSSSSNAAFVYQYNSKINDIFSLDISNEEKETKLSLLAKEIITQKDNNASASHNTNHYKYGSREDSLRRLTDVLKSISESKIKK